MAAQAEVAVDLCDVVLFVVEYCRTVGATATDEHVVRMLRETMKPVILVANKVDDASTPRPRRSGISGSASRTRCRRCTAAAWPTARRGLQGAPQVSAVAKEEFGGPRRVAILGRPNVGKSSLLNKAAREERVVVNELAGATRDPVDEQIELGGKIWTFVDTAGIRRRVHLQQGADFYASLRTQAALEKAEVAVVLLDVTEPISEPGRPHHRPRARVGPRARARVQQVGPADDERRRYLEREIEQDLHHVQWAPRVNISAKTGRHLEKLVPALETALESWDTRIPTGKFNAFLTELMQAHPHPLRGGKQPASCSARRPRPARRRSCCSRRGSSTRATAGSSSAACARSTASTARPSSPTCACARSASGRGRMSRRSASRWS